MNIQVRDLSYSIQKQKLIDRLSLQVKTGEFVGLIGPNGSGKSTLLKNIYRVLKPDEGKVNLDHHDILNLTSRQTAQNMAVLGQESSLVFDFKVKEIVLMGRSPYKRMFEIDNDKDKQIVEQAMERVGMLQYGERSFLTLSGGEKQRVLIARALAQQAKVIVLDEPTNHLDIKYQLQIMDLVKSLDVTVLAALHDINIAAAYCDYIYVINEGRIEASGKPAEVLTCSMLQEIFGVDTDVRIHAVSGKPHITFFSEYITRG